MGKGGDASNNRIDFFRTNSDEPHSLRRKTILKLHPEIEDLYGPDWRPAPIAIMMVISQLFLACYSQFMSWPVFLIISYVYGGTVAHSLSLMTHELSHCLVFKSKTMNEYFGIFCNIGMGLHSSSTFKRYHLEHHLFQGVEGKDADIATIWEGAFFTSIFFKTIYLLLMTAVYAIRPLAIMPKQLNKLELLNICVVWTCNVFLVRNFGWSAGFYLFISLVFGHGLHPMSGHFIAEHYIFVEGQETYSYYGWMNILTWNVGYHNEHHDFPRIAGWKLPQVKAIAPEFYDNLVHHKSWCYVLYCFITDPTITPFNRVVRKKRYNRDVIVDEKVSSKPNDLKVD